MAPPCCQSFSACSSHSSEPPLRQTARACICMAPSLAANASNGPIPHPSGAPSLTAPTTAQKTPPAPRCPTSRSPGRSGTWRPGYGRTSSSSPPSWRRPSCPRRRPRRSAAQRSCHAPCWPTPWTLATFTTCSPRWRPPTLPTSAACWGCATPPAAQGCRWFCVWGGRDGEWVGAQDLRGAV